MQAKIVRRHFGAAEGEVYPRWFEVGSEVSGQVAEAAMQMGDAVPLDQSGKGEEQSSASQQAPALPKSKPRRRKATTSSRSTTPGGSARKRSTSTPATNGGGDTTGTE